MEISKCLRMFVVLTASGLCAAGSVVAPYVEVGFGGSGNVSSPHNLGTERDSFFVSDTRVSGPSDPGTYSLYGYAGFSALGVSSVQNGPLEPGKDRVRNVFGAMIDRVLITSADPSATTYRWQPTVRITGLVDWTSAGDSPGDWPVAIFMAQYTRTEDQVNFVRYSVPDMFPDKGEFDEVIQLDEIPVPVNEPFNYRLLFGVSTRLKTSSDGLFEISYASADFARTLDVVGLSVTDSAGNAVDWNSISGTAATYSANGINAVPEPGSAILIAAGAVAVVLRKKLRRHLTT